VVEPEGEHDGFAQVCGVFASGVVLVVRGLGAAGVALVTVVPAAPAELFLQVSQGGEGSVVRERVAGAGGLGPRCRV
jgi:hypothetical protein